MRMKRRIGYGVLAALLFLLCLSIKGRAWAEEEGETMRVLVPLMNDSGYVAYENGEFSGYYIDYLNEIAKYTGWNYEFTPVQSYEELEEMCAKGDFDLMTGIVYSEEYDGLYFDYPRHASGAKRYVFAVPRDSELTPDKEYSYLRGVRIGIASNSGITELEERFRNFCFMYGIRCVSDEEDYQNGVNFIHIDPSAWREKLASGEIDGVLAADTFCLAQDMYAITTFGLDQIYFVAPNGRDEVVKALNDAMDKINSFDPEYNDRLYETYFSQTMRHIISFNSGEKQYLEQEHSWRVALPENYAPYSYINDKGEPAGMIPEVMRRIRERTEGKTNFEYIFYDSIQEAADAVKAGECEIAGISTYSLMHKRGGGERRSMAFYADSFMYYKSSGVSLSDAGPMKAAPELPFMLLESRRPEDKEAVQDVPGKCLEQVEEGKSGYTVMLSGVGDYYKSYYGYSGLEDYPVPEADVLFCFTYSPAMEQMGIGILDKCLAGLDEEELEGYVTELSLFDHKEQTIGDYIKKHLELFTLLLVGVLSVICALLAAAVVYVTRNSRRIHELLYHDKVTGGMSYLKFMEEAGQAVRKPGKWLMLYINISSFKYVNDVFGYGLGNEVLCEVAEFLEKRMQGMLRARVYADRFVALIPYSSQERAREEIQKSLDLFEETSRDKFPSFNIWIKVGAYDIKEGDDIQKAVNLANYAVDEIQKTSKNEYIFYDEVMHERVLTQKEIEKDMRGAMEKGEFEAFYQPKYNIDTKELIGAEALVRWRHPVKGLLSPGVFIPIFEKNHFILQVDFYIFECVCRFLQRLIREGKRCFPISSNFSRLHLSQPDFVERLQAIVERYQVPPEYLEIEITETFAVAEFDQLIVTVKRLKACGFQVSIDDFGSGYSSIQLLYKLPIDVLKFDKAFVDNEDASEIEIELVDSIISVSRRNGIRIICEGVETLEQEEFVREHNCIYVQGFLYSRPVAEKEFYGLLETKE